MASCPNPARRTTTLSPIWLCAWLYDKPRGALGARGENTVTAPPAGLEPATCGLEVPDLQGFSVAYGESTWLGLASVDHTCAESETQLGTLDSPPPDRDAALPRPAQPFEPLDDQREIGLLTASVVERVDEFAGLELALPETPRPVPVDLTTHQLAKDLADWAVAGSGAEVSPHVV